MKEKIEQVENLAKLSLANFKRITDSCETIEQYSNGLVDYGIQLAINLKRTAKLKQPCFFERGIYNLKINKIISQFYKDFVSVLFDNQIRLNSPKTNQ